MLMRIVGCALLAGLVAGGASALLQQALVVPLILEAERYETGEAVHFAGLAASADAPAAHEPGDGAAADEHGDEAAVHAHGDAAAPHEHGESGGGIARHLTTAVMTIAVNVGFAFLLLAAFHARDAQPDPREGLVWGIAGFVAFMLAPAAGLAPELPGIPAAPLEPRQLWWAATAASAAGALWLIAFVGQGWAVVAALALLVVPHLIGAPRLDAYGGVAPPELAAEFAARALAVGLVGWAVLGAAAAWAWGRRERAPDSLTV